jgi:hypothetical protein
MNNTKAYNISLDKEAVERIKKIGLNSSFSSYLSDLIKKDIESRNSIKKMSQIFGKDFKPQGFLNKEEEESFYNLIGLTDYALHTKD